jgi:hypothetical protein
MIVKTVIMVQQTVLTPRQGNVLNVNNFLMILLLLAAKTCLNPYSKLGFLCAFL